MLPKPSYYNIAIIGNGSLAISVKNITKNAVSTALIKENPMSLTPQNFLILLLILFIVRSSFHCDNISYSYHSKKLLIYYIFKKGA